MVRGGMLDHRLAGWTRRLYAIHALIIPGHYGSGYHWPRYCNWRNGTADETGDGIVDYPLTLSGLIVEQREKVVYVNAMVDASKQPVRLSDLKAVYGDPQQVGDWEQHATALP